MKTSPLLSHHEAQGARLADRPEAPGHATPLTFGDVPAEYAAGRESVLLFDAGDRGRVRVSGSDAANFLHKMLAGPILTLAPGQGGANMLLTPKGKVRASFQVQAHEGSFTLDTPPGAAADLIAALDGYLFTEDVTLEDESETFAPLELTGPGASALLAKIVQGEPAKESGTHSRSSIGELDVRIACVPVAGSPGYRINAEPSNGATAEATLALWNTLVESGAQPGGLIARDCLRTEAGAPLWGIDISDESYPQEARLERAFSLDKGCYVGQEVVAKIDTYGGLNKCLYVLRISHDDPTAPGTRLLRTIDDEERDLGVLTTWAYSFELDTGIALGYVKRRHQAVGTTFRLGDGSGEAEIVRFPLRDDAIAPTGEFE